MSLIKQDEEIKSLFSTIPNLKICFQSFENDVAFPKNFPIKVACVGRASTIVGHAFDYWFRAFVQYRNHLVVESTINDLVASWILKSENEFGNATKTIQRRYHEVFKRRKRIIKGLKVEHSDFLVDCLFLGNLEAFYRNGYIREEGIMYVSEDEVEDLENITNSVNEVSRYFVVNEKLICNPHFGKVSILVGGADGDLVIDNTFIDIKNESIYGYKIQHVRQLLGYYILSLLTPDFPIKIDRLAIYYPRFQRYVFIDVADIARVMDLEIFTRKFVSILFKKQPRILKNQGFNKSLKTEIDTQIQNNIVPLAKLYDPVNIEMLSPPPALNLIVVKLMQVEIFSYDWAELVMYANTIDLKEIYKITAYEAFLYRQKAWRIFHQVRGVL